MLISHSRPTLMFSTNGTFLDDPAILTSGRPGETARIQIPSAGPLTLSAVFDAAVAPRLFGLLNTTFDVGSVVTLSLDGVVVASQPIVAQPRGERICWIMLPDTTAATSSLSLSISAPASSTSTASAQDIGEIWIGAGADIPVLVDYGAKLNDSSVTQPSFSRQLYTQRGTVWRTLRFTPAPVFDQARGSLWAHGDFDALLANLDRGQSAVYIPTITDNTGTFSQDVLLREVIFGQLSQLPENKHLGNKIFGPTEMQVTESPITV